MNMSNSAVQDLVKGLAPHQEAVLNKLSNGSILWANVGTGKSRVAIHYYLKAAKGKQLVIITTAKKRDTLDWKKEAAYQSIEPIVDSWNNLWKYINYKDSFFIFDEQRLVGKGAWVKAFIKIAKYNQWILLSATPGDTWMDYIPVFIANGFYKNRTEFISEHVIYKPFQKFPKIDRFVNVNRLVKQRNKILVQMLYKNQTVRHAKTVRVEHDVDLLNKTIKERWHPYEDRPIRDISELFMVMRKIVNSDPSRIEAVKELLEKHPKLIVFYNFDYELEALRSLSSVVELREWNGHKHEEIPETSKWLYVVQYTAGSEGWNCIETDAICFYSLTYSYKIWEQAHGRIDRMNSPFLNLFYYTLRSNSPVDRVIWQSLKAKKTFNERAFSEEILSW